MKDIIIGLLLVLVVWLAFLYLMTPEVPVRMEGKKSNPGKMSDGSHFGNFQFQGDIDHQIDFSKVRDPFQRVK